MKKNFQRGSHVLYNIVRTINVLIKSGRTTEIRFKIIADRMRVAIRNESIHFSQTIDKIFYLFILKFITYDCIDN